MIYAKAAGIIASLILLLALTTSCDSQGTGLEQSTDKDDTIDIPLTEREQIMKENKDLFRERIAELEINDTKRESLLEYLFKALWQFEMGRIQELTITLDEDATENNHFGYAVYNVTFNDDLGFEYAGSIDEEGGVSAFTQDKVDPETGLLHHKLAAPPIS